MPYDAELTELRERVDCRAVLERAGWQLDRRESSRRSAKYRRSEGEIIVVTHDGKGWFDPLAEAARGDVIALAQRLWGGTLGHARKALRPLAGIAPSLLPETVEAARPYADCRTAWLRRAPPRPGSAAWRYLTDVRALPPDMLTRLGKMGLIREGFGGTTWFLHQVEDVPVGWEMRGPAYKGFAAGGRKTLFVLAESWPPKVVMVCEGAIDALSLAVLDGFDPATAYVSTGGGWGDGAAPASSSTPPSELIRPPSNAAVTFLWHTLGSENGSSVSSSLAGMADSVRALGLASAPKLNALPDGYTMSVSESLLCGE